MNDIVWVWASDLSKGGETLRLIVVIVTKIVTIRDKID